jgi:hypothetical protein
LIASTVNPLSGNGPAPMMAAMVGVIGSAAGSSAMSTWSVRASMAVSASSVLG